MTTYYVKNGGNNSADGLSDANAWETLAKVNSTVSGDGDKVLFKCGSTWTNQSLWIDWQNYIIGAYYGNGVEGISGTRPIFEGTLPTYVDTSTNTDGYPSNAWNSIIDTATTGLDGTIENIIVQKSAGLGIRQQGTNSLKITANVSNCKTYQTTNSGIFSKHADAGLHAGNYVQEACMAYASVGEVSAPSWFRPAAYPVQSCAGQTFQDNTIIYSHGEGFQTNEWANDLIYQDNIIISTRAGFNIWCNSSTHYTYNITIRRNLIYGTDSATYDVGVWTSYGGPAIYLNDVSYNAVYNVYIYNNLVASRGYMVAFADPSTLIGTSYSVFIYGNTGVRLNRPLALTGSSANLSGTNAVKNNIFTSLVNGWNGGTIAALPWDYNAWDSTPATGSGGANDVIGDIDLVGSSWTNPADTDFQQNSGSSTIDKGVDLGSPYNEDFWEISRSGDWDMGGHEYVAAGASKYIYGLDNFSIYDVSNPEIYA